MYVTKKVRLNRLLKNGRCLDVAIDHGVCNEPSFMSGLEDMEKVVKMLVTAGPDAIQMNYGQSDLLQSLPGQNRPALVMRLDMGNPYNRQRHREMWAVLQNEADPIMPALRMDAACVVVNLFMLPDEPGLFKQCVQNISRLGNDCEKYGMPLMIEPLVMLPNEKGGYLVDGDTEKVVTLVRLAREMGADIIKADPTDEASDFHHVVQAARCPVLVRGGGKADLRRVFENSAALIAEGAHGMVYGGGADGDDPWWRGCRRGLGHLRKRRQAVSAFLGIDAGNTGVKAVLFDDAGRALASAHRDTGVHSPAPGMVERDIRRLRSDLDGLVRELLGKSGLKGSDISGIGTSGHGNGLYLLDAEGEPVAAIQSLDTRAAGLVEEWNGSGVAGAAEAICLQRPWAAQTPALLAWMSRYRPETMVRAAHLLMCKDLVTHALTGEIAGDVSDMGGAGLLRLPENSYDDDLLDAYGLAQAKILLPKLYWPVDVVGKVTEAAAGRTGLAVGTPVVAGFFDVMASAVGAGVTRPWQASLILGTWSINQAIVETPVGGVFMSAPLAPGRFMSMENSATSATNLEWLAHNLLAHDSRADKGPFALADALALMAVPKPDGPLYHPYLYGASRNASARAGWFGLAGWHDGADMLRALFEGVAFAHLAHIERLEASGVDTGDITLSGGGAKSPVWQQMIADMLGRPVKVAAQAESGALGAAMAAAVGTGRYRDIDAAAEAMVAAPVIVEPSPGVKEFYKRRFALWQAVEASLSPHWTALRELGDG